jgi:hypothetical protein
VTLPCQVMGTLRNWVSREPRAAAPLPELHPRSCVGLTNAVPHGLINHAKFEDAMATRQRGQIVETPTEARQAEPGPSVAALLAISTGLAILILAVVWFVFFRT